MHLFFALSLPALVTTNKREDFEWWKQKNEISQEHKERD